MTLSHMLKVRTDRLRGRIRGHPQVRLGARVKLTGPGSYDLRPGSQIHDDAQIWVGEGASLVLHPGASIGNRAIVNVASGVSVGERSAISWDTQVLDTDFHIITGADGIVRPHTSPIEIGAGVLIGTGVLILKGVKIGDGAIVAAGSVVTKSVAPGVIVAGNPARAVGIARSWT